MVDNEMISKDAANVIEGIQEFLSEFQSVNGLFKRAAKGMSELLFLQAKYPSDDFEEIVDMVNDYMCLLNVLEPLSENGKSGSDD